ncbi:hypothetical protein B0T24DRAFT_205852 [Lasiosphaeria ovina]|uniref:Uncharacterized protein n=1 Tax=Lasiosphaeria ovina TaxID=92902 RepID=A0AAE0N9H4_9PEZI|nr:hypothetical protein B0T24DRAFT_205852 [Lasiosphaeria ovina]
MAFAALVAAVLAMAELSAAADGDAMSVPAQIEAHANDTAALHTIKAPGWVPGYAYRGTLNILWSCLITLTACVYTVIHLNVPSADESRRRQLLNKVVWAIWAVVCPEMVVYIALSQFRSAKTLVLRLNAEIERQTGVKGKFTMRDAFFIHMGAIHVHVRDVFPSSHQKRAHVGSGAPETVPVTGKGMIKLFQTGCLSVDSFHHIRTRVDDKSKADSIAKALVVGQVCWMAAQCIARAAYGLPIALLEIHTMVHVLCALLIYAVWFRVSCNGIGRACRIGLLSGKKPQDVRQPEIIDSSNALDGIVARMVEAQFTKSASDGTVVYPQPSKEVQRLQDLESSGKVLPGQALKCGLGPKEVYSKPVRFEKQDLLRWERILGENGILGLERPMPLCSRVGADCVVDARDFGSCLGLVKIRNMPKKLLSRSYPAALDEDDFVYGFALIGLVLLAEGLYSGLHSIAWNHEFPSRVEALLWRMACVAVSAWSVPWGGVMMLDEFFNQGDEVGMGIRWLKNTCAIIFFVLVAVAVVARPFIIFESFLALRSEPIGVYWIPAWLQMIPHV